jgi:hypothetical protein
MQVTFNDDSKATEVKPGSHELGCVWMDRFTMKVSTQSRANTALSTQLASTEAATRQFADGAVSHRPRTLTPKVANPFAGARLPHPDGAAEL